MSRGARQDAASRSRKRRGACWVYRREARLARPIRAVAGFVVAVLHHQAPRLLGRR